MHVRKVEPVSYGYIGIVSSHLRSSTQLLIFIEKRGNLIFHTESALCNSMPNYIYRDFYMSQSEHAAGRQAHMPVTTDLS